MIRLTSVDLPTLGRPTTAITGRVRARSTVSVWDMWGGSLPQVARLCSDGPVVLDFRAPFGAGGPGKVSPVRRWAPTT